MHWLTWRGDLRAGNLGDSASVNNQARAIKSGSELLNRISRREFLKKAAVGAAAAALLPSFVSNLAPIARAASQPEPVTFQFAAVSKAPPVEGVEHRIAMSGNGLVTPGNVAAGGSFTHYDNSGLKDPKTILQSGEWKATDLVDFNLIGTWGNGPFSAGTVEMDVNLNRQFPSELVIPARLKVIANLGSAGLTTGQPQGFTLTIPNAPYGPFTPFADPKKKSKKKGLVFITNKL
jgi:hypothetical protein